MPDQVETKANECVDYVFAKLFPHIVQDSYEPERELLSKYIAVKMNELLASS